MKSSLFAFLTIAVLVLAACGGQPSTLPPAGTPAAKPATAAEGPAGQGWEQQWNKVLSEARKEESLRIVTAAASDAREEISQAFKQRTGVTLEWLAGRVAETSQ